MHSTRIHFIPRFMVCGSLSSGEPSSAAATIESREQAELPLRLLRHPSTIRGPSPALFCQTPSASCPIIVVRFPSANIVGARRAVGCSTCSRSPKHDSWVVLSQLMRMSDALAKLLARGRSGTELQRRDRCIVHSCARMWWCMGAQALLWRLTQRW